MKDFDAIDKRLLEMLQQDSQRPIGELAEAVNLSSTPAWRRIHRLKDSGVITRNVALLDRQKLNLGVTVFTMIKTNHHSEEWFNQFHAAVIVIPEVMEFYRMSGDVDYLLRIVVPDIGAYDAVYKKLTRTAKLFDVSSSFAMEELKFTTELPLHFMT